VNALQFGLIFVAPPFLKSLLLQWFCGAKIGRRARVGWFSAVSGRHVELGEHSCIRPFTLVRLHGDVRLGRYSEISSFTLIYGSSSLTLGDHSYVGPQSLINVEEEVRIGHGSALGPRSMVFTHGSFLPYTEGYWIRLAGVTLGDRVWCAAGVFLHPGVEIGDDSFVNSMSVVTQSIPPGSVVEGNPAQVVYPTERVKRKMSPARVDLALRQMLRDFAEIGLRRELGLKDIQADADALRFAWRGQTYAIVLVPSTGTPSAGDPRRTHQIFIVNRAGWSAPRDAQVLDLTTLRTPFVSEPIHTALRLFCLRYYGVKFEDDDGVRAARGAPGPSGEAPSTQS
jgi:acetyltransferase-like isoleucine patch superfamily enzyme